MGERPLLFIFGLTFVINLIATLAYSIRIAGTRTGRIAISLSLFNILVLVSRTSNSFQAPLLTRRVEHALLTQAQTGITADLTHAQVGGSAEGVPDIGLLLTNIHLLPALPTTQASR